MKPRILGGVAVVLLLLALWVWWANTRDEAPLDNNSVQATPQILANGRNLALAGNCVGCHTQRGGQEYAGGRSIETPFGNVYASNLTPDVETGLGQWTAAEFWRAMHNGRSKDGRLLYPAFPYQHFTLLTRADSDAIYAYLRTVPPAKQVNRDHALRFPYNLQTSLAVWRALYFKPGEYEPDSARSPEWNRGAYLVHGLGHCGACHAARNRLGATLDEIELGGGLIPAQNWYAPSLANEWEGGVQHWPLSEAVALLRDGVSPRGSVLGPMAEVVFRSTQHLPESDLIAMATYLKELPPVETHVEDRVTADAQTMKTGGKIYADRCAECHGDRGEGFENKYPALASNRAINFGPSNNVIKAILHGGFPPTTAGNPRPFGMPGFSQSLNDRDLAAVATYIRQAWGNKGAPVTATDVAKNR